MVRPQLQRKDDCCHRFRWKLTVRNEGIDHAGSWQDATILMKESDSIWINPAILFSLVILDLVPIGCDRLTQKARRYLLTAGF